MQRHHRLARAGRADDPGRPVEVALHELALGGVEEHGPVVPRRVERGLQRRLVAHHGEAAARVGVGVGVGLGCRDAHRGRLAHRGGEHRLLRLVGQVRGDVEHRVLGRLTHRLQPVLGHAPAQQRVVVLPIEEAGPAHGLLDVSVGDDGLDGLADLHDLGGAGARVAVEPPPLGPGVGVVVVADIGEQRLAVPPVQDDAQVAVHPGGPEARIAGALHAVERQAGARGVGLDVEGRDLGRGPLLPGEPVEALGEAAGDADGHGFFNLSLRDLRIARRSTLNGVAAPAFRNHFFFLFNLSKIASTTDFFLRRGAPTRASEVGAVDAEDLGGGSLGSFPWRVIRSFFRDFSHSIRPIAKPQTPSSPRPRGG